MSTENQNRENQNEKVDYQDLFNSLVKENEQKEPMAEKAKSKIKRINNMFPMKIYIIVMLKITVEHMFHRKKADFINLPVLIAEKK